MFDIVVLALGFGLERTMTPLPARPYWEKDDLDDATRGAWLVSGSGDGAWTDLFRLATPEFRQATMEEEFLSAALVPRHVRRLLINMEQRALRERIVGRDADRELTQLYNQRNCSLLQPPLPVPRQLRPHFLPQDLDFHDQFADALALIECLATGSFSRSLKPESNPARAGRAIVLYIGTDTSHEIASTGSPRSRRRTTSW